MKAKRWARYQELDLRQRTVIARIGLAGHPEIVSKMQVCGDFINVLSCEDCGTKYFSSFSRCGHRFCLKCSWARSLVWLSRVVPVMQDLIREGYYVSFCTFTIRDEMNLEGMLSKLRSCWAGWYGDKMVRERLAGFVRSLEGTWDGDYHLHLHTLVLTGSFGKDYELFTSTWKRVARFYGTEGSVDVRGVRNPVRGCLEILKYITKLDELVNYPDKVVSEMLYGFKGVRQVSMGGEIRKRAGRVDIERELETVDEKKLTEFICQKCGCTEAELKSWYYESVSNYILYDCIRREQ